ncbi:hypothetical protein, partial [Caballeronia glebae]|uniref:hypothetical protein n=1 Tax=Caballeronia glebae TaxID=1777143 RepID=UPI001F44331C
MLKRKHKDGALALGPFQSTVRLNSATNLRLSAKIPLSPSLVEVTEEGCTDALPSTVMSKIAKVQGVISLIVALALFICIDRYYKLAAAHPGNFVFLWLCAQYCLAVVLFCFMPTASSRTLKEKLLIALLIGGFMGGATLPKVFAAFDAFGGPQELLSNLVFARRGPVRRQAVAEPVCCR